MKKIVLILSLVMSVNVFADTMDDAKKAYKYESYEKAIELYEKACNGKNAYACEDAAYMYKIGKKGVKKDLIKVKEFYKQACIHGRCYAVEKILAKEELKNFFTKLCDENIGIGCFYLAKKETGQKMAELYLKACDNGYPKGCYELARKQNRDKNKYPTKKILKKGCTLGSKSACMRLGRIFKVNKDYSKVLKYICKACDMNGSGACYKMSYIYRDGKYGVDKNLTMAKIFCDKAESLGMVNVCGSVLNKEILLLKEAQKGKNYGN